LNNLSAKLQLDGELSITKPAQTLLSDDQRWF